MDEQQRKALLKESFNTVSGGYDGKPLRFFPKSAALLASCLELGGDEHVLDVATGTGNAALCLAGHLPQGRVTGVDFSAGMLAQARKKAEAGRLSNVEFVEGDMQDLGFPADSFDAAACAFGIFFLDDMDAQMTRIVKTVKPGGKIAISGFQENYFYPLKDLMIARLISYGLQMPPPTWKRIATEAGCRELFTLAGLSEIRVEAQNVGYYLESAEEWWYVIWNAGYRRMVSQLTAGEQERFKREHLQEVAQLQTADGIWLDVGVLLTVGRKPLEQE